MKTLVLSHVLLLLFILEGITCFTTNNEALLRTHVFTTRKYDVDVRPEALVTVRILFNLLTINQLDIRSQTFRASGWLTLLWDDNRLTWNDTGFGSIRFLFASQNAVWRPALLISNSVENLGVIQDAYTPFRITNDGLVIWEPPGIYEVHCEIDISYYPFDEQECYITIQSWGYNLREVNVTAEKNGINLNEFKTNGEWDLTGTRTTWGDSEDAKGDSYAQLKYFFKLRRKSQYYWLNVLLPVIVNSILTALVFALPAESGEKMGYSLTVLLSFAVLLTLVADKIPSTSTTTSIIVVYFSVVLILASLAVALSTIVLDLYFHDENDPVPGWLRKVFRLLAYILCYDGCKKRQTSVMDVDGNQAIQPNRHSENGRTIKADRLSSLDSKPKKQHSWVGDSGQQDMSWKDISRILDSFLLRFYVLAIILITVSFLTAAEQHV